jgi:periplasmic protein TonB
MSLSIWFGLVGLVGSIDNPIVPDTPISKRLVSGTISDLDYPTILLRKGSRGSTLVKILIDPKGKVKTCELLVSSSEPILDQQTCGLILRRFRYKPMKDENGQRAWVSDTVKVNWERPAF